MKLRAIFFTALVSGCGTEDPNPPTTESLFPLTVGNRWEYKVTDEDFNVETKIQTVTSTAPDGAFMLLTDRGSRQVHSVQRIDAEGRLVRISEYSTFEGVPVERIVFTPPDIRVDTDDYALGTTYEQTYLEDHDPRDANPDVEKTQRFTVEAVDDPITVPAGTFRAIKLRRVTNDDGPSKMYWFVPGIGKILELGGQREELAAHQIQEVMQ